MALVLKDRVKETSTTAGTGTLTLAGAVSGFQSFAAVGNGNTTYYAIADSITGDWEVGIGTYTSSGTTLSRTTVLSSSNGGSLVNFAANAKDVFVTYPSSKSAYQDAAGVIAQQSFGAITATSAALTTGTITTAPVNNTDIVNKQYADAIASGIHFHEAVNLATTAALPANTYNNGTSGVGATLTANANGALSIDSTLTTATERVLIKNEAAGANNGVYTVTQVGSAGTPYILTRATDFDSVGTGVNEIDEGDFFLVTSGTANVNTAWVQQTPPPITIGTTALVFQQFSAPITYTAGTGLTESPTYTFNIGTTGVTATTYGSASQVPVFAVNAQGQLTSVTNTAIAINGSAVSGNISGSAGSVANALTLGTYLTGTSYNGSSAVTAAVDATSTNTVSKVVARDSSGNFAAGTITAALSGNASTSTAATNISGGAANQIPYNTASATTSFITAPTTAGTYLNWTGSAFAYSAISTPASVTFNNGGSGDASGTSFNGSTARTISYNTVGAPSTGGTGATGTWGISISGNAATATSATSASTATFATTAGSVTGQANSATITAATANTASTIVLRDASGNFSAGTITAALNGNASTATTAANVNNGTLTMNVSGTGLSGSQTFTANQAGAATFTVASNATNANTGSTIVARDASGNFSAGTITATLSGNASTATSATTAGSITSQANSATITASSSNTANQIVLRDASGNFSAGTITASLSGNASTATTATSANALSGITSSISSAVQSSTITSVIAQDTNGALYRYNAGGVATFISGQSMNISGSSTSCSGNAATATALSSGQSNWSGTGVLGNVVGMLAWKNYANGHVIFDASAGTSPSGGAVNNTNSAVAWSSTYPTLMGWNGATTYGVRVDSARISDSTSGSAGSVDFANLTNKGSGTGTYTTSGDYRAPIFYDSDNTGYYVNPASYSYMYEVAAASYVYGGYLRSGTNVYTDQNYGYGLIGAYSSTRFQGVFAMGDAYKLPPDGTTTGNLYGIAWSYPSAGGAAANLASHGMLILQNGVFQGAWGGGSLRTPGDVRGTLFYDWDNTTYYIDPAASTALSIYGGITFGVANPYLTASSYIVFPGGAYFNSGTVYINSNLKARGGVGDDNNAALVLTGGTSGYTEINGSTRSPIYYDLNNTAFYCDPSSTSDFNTLRCTANITAYYSSDIRFKTNVRDIPNALEIAESIGGKLFDWTDEYIEEHGGEDDYFMRKADFGVVAQDVLKVFPVAVRTRPDGSLAVDYEKLSALAFAAVASLSTRVKSLEARI
jgi:hypothetical protein